MEQKRILVSKATLVLTGCNSNGPIFLYSARKKLNRYTPLADFPFKKIVNGITPAGMGLIFIKELVLTFGAGPHGKGLF